MNCSTRRRRIARASRASALPGLPSARLRFPPVVESQLVQQWVSTWLQRAQLERNLVERKRSYAVHDGKETALREYAEHAARLLAEGLVDQEGNPLSKERRQ